MNHKSRRTRSWESLIWPPPAPAGEGGGEQSAYCAGEGRLRGIRLVICSCSSPAWRPEKENKHKRRRRGKDGDAAQERRGSMRELHLAPLPEFIDRNTCATLSHNTAYDQYGGPDPHPSASVTCTLGRGILLLALNFLFFPLCPSGFSLTQLVPATFQLAAVWRGLVTGLSWVIYTSEKKKKNTFSAQVL